MKLCRPSTSLATRTEWVRLPPSPSRRRPRRVNHTTKGRTKGTNVNLDTRRHGGRIARHDVGARRGLHHVRSLHAGRRGRGLEHDSSTSWATERMSLEGLFHLALCTHRERGERAALLDLHSVIGSDCLAHLRLARGRAYVTAAARSVDALAAARTWLRERFPDSKPHEKKEVQMSFWTNDRGGWRMSRSIAVPAWSEITGNYPQDVGTQIRSLADRQFDDVHSGRLILWHGVPGTGKTHALRALAWEWREWCSFHYITDPETFFGGRPRYMLDVLLDEDDDDEDWRLLILEDTGELLALDAKRQMGQGLSRLLNVVDGLIGQGLRVL